MNQFVLLGLRGQAGVCKYVIECTGCNANIDYTEQILHDVLCCGIVDPDIQLELLGHTNQDMKLEEVFHFVETKEAGKRLATHLFDNQAATVKSTYSRNKKDNIKPLSNLPMSAVTLNTNLPSAHTAD